MFPRRRHVVVARAALGAVTPLAVVAMYGRTGNHATRGCIRVVGASKPKQLPRPRFFLRARVAGRHLSL
jgi:hypothetical protein